MYALIKNNKIETFDKSRDARKAKRHSFERIVKVDKSGLVNLELHINQQKERFLKKQVKVEKKVMKWNFEKLSDETKLELRTAFEDKNTPLVKKIIIANKVKPDCSSCGYNVDTAAEWIQDAIDKNIL